MKSYQQVIKRIHGECQIIDQVINRAMHAWREASKQPDTQSIYLDAVALNLHVFYTRGKIGDVYDFMRFSTQLEFPNTLSEL